MRRSSNIVDLICFFSQAGIVFGRAGRLHRKIIDWKQEYETEPVTKAYQPQVTSRKFICKFMLLYSFTIVHDDLLSTLTVRL